jgi:hypothetical protein
MEEQIKGILASFAVPSPTAIETKR